MKFIVRSSSENSNSHRLFSTKVRIIEDKRKEPGKHLTLIFWLPLPYMFRTKYYNAIVRLAREVDNARRYFEPDAQGFEPIWDSI